MDELEERGLKSSHKQTIMEEFLRSKTDKDQTFTPLLNRTDSAAGNIERKSSFFKIACLSPESENISVLLDK